GTVRAQRHPRVSDLLCGSARIRYQRIERPIRRRHKSYGRSYRRKWSYRIDLRRHSRPATSSIFHRAEEWFRAITVAETVSVSYPAKRFNHKTHKRHEEKQDKKHG